MFTKSLAIACAIGASSLALANEVERTPLPGCANEIATYCNGVEKGRGRIAKCLRENKERLSDVCKADIQELMAQMKQRREDRRATGRGGQSGKQ
jgi:hypothetical protein